MSAGPHGRVAPLRPLTPLALALATLLPAAAAPAGDASPALLAWTGPEGQEVGFPSLAALADFLQNAHVVERKILTSGITRPERFLLERSGLRLRAQFQPVDVVHDEARTPSGEVERNARDSYRYNIAAFEVGALLGMDNVPPSFLRIVDGRRGAITVWIENVFTERDRLARDRQPPDAERWSRQHAVARLFDELIANVDRNQGNFLIDADWKLWLIDHTRAFRPRPRLADPEAITGCERGLWERLRRVSDEALAAAVEPWLSRGELRALLERRRRVVERIEELLDSGDETSVLWSG